MPPELRVLEANNEADGAESIQYIDDNMTMNSLRETDKYNTKDYFAKMRDDLDTNDLYQNGAKLRQLYKLIKENNIPEERLSKRVQ